MKTWAKYISWERKCKFDGRKCNSNQWWNNDKFRCECKKINECKKDYVWNSSKCICENGKQLANIVDDSAIIYDEVIKSYEQKIKTIPTNFNEKKVACKKAKFLYFTWFFIN